MGYEHICKVVLPYSHMVVLPYSHMVVLPYSHMVVLPYSHMVCRLHMVYHDIRKI